MSINGDALKALIDRELTTLLDPRVLTHIRSLLVEPRIVFRDWDYGKPGEQYPCWSVLEDGAWSGGIAYCEYGFGPRCPWGLVWLEGNDNRTSMGMDSGWFTTFLDACFDSHSIAALPIWCVLRIDASGTRQFITDEDSWDTTWALVMRHRAADPASRYDCEHSISCGR